MIIDNEYGTQGPRMSCKLTFLGVIWSILSLIIPIIISVAYYLPYWLVGSYHGIIQVSFGSFRRCNYPHMKNDGSIEIIKECGRYTTFGDIPSLSWQVLKYIYYDFIKNLIYYKITTILVGVGTAASLLVGFTVLAGCCLSDVITKSTSRTLGLIQLISGIYLFKNILSKIFNHITQ